MVSAVKVSGEGSAMRPVRDAGEAGIAIVPVVVVMQTFPARPSAVPDIREFVRGHPAMTPLSEEGLRALGRHVEEVLLESAGTGRTIQVSLRIFDGSAEVDVIQTQHAEMIGTVGSTAAPPPPEEAGPSWPEPRVGAGTTGGIGTTTGTNDQRAPGTGAAGGDRRGCPALPCPGTSFPEWLADALRREGMTMEAAARQLGVSVKTVSRWIGGTTEPRLRDLSRMREVFGYLPFP